MPTMDNDVYDNRPCQLGEGVFWHPARQALFWFDICAEKLLWRGTSGTGELSLPERGSAAGIIDRSRVLLGVTSGLIWLNLDDGTSGPVARFPDAEGLVTNDGRADPWGGFWISRMAPDEAAGAGEIWRWSGGEFRRVINGLTIPNAICFDAARQRLYWADTLRHQIMVQNLDAAGWPQGQPGLFYDLTDQGGLPDGAITDACGNLWVALWGSGRVICVSPDGRLLSEESFGARQTSCPAFGGADFNTLFVTSAFDGMTDPDCAADPLSGMTFARQIAVGKDKRIGLAEPMVRLSPG